jgi:hypothetical protein
VEAALDRLRENETVFLHPSDLCRECDEARASLTGGTSSRAGQWLAAQLAGKRRVWNQTELMVLLKLAGTGCAS